MNETFENALDIAHNLAGHSNMKLTSLGYSPYTRTFTAYYADKKGHSWVDIRETHFNSLMDEIKAHYELDSPAA